MKSSGRSKPKRMPRTSPAKEKVAISLIRGIWDSLQSHLDYCVEDSPEGKTFHRKCVKDYAEQIKLASDLL